MPPPAFSVLHTFAPVEVPSGLGIRPMAGSSDARVGDCVVFSLTLERGKETRQWFVIAAIAARRSNARGVGSAQFASGQRLEEPLQGMVRFHVRVVDSAGARLGESISKPLSIELLRIGLAGIAAFGAKHREVNGAELEARVRRMERGDRRAIVLSIAAMTSLVDLVLNCECLAPVLSECVRRPSWAAMLTGFRAGIGLSLDAERSQPWTRPLPMSAEAAFEIPLRVKAFGELALTGSAVVVRSKLSLLSGGLVSLVGTHPDDPGHRARLPFVQAGTLPDAERRRSVELERNSPLR